MAKAAKNKALKRSQSSVNAVSKRLYGKADAPDLPNVKFKPEKLPIPDLPLGNRACCCRIGR
jgi:hypothetical protein